jgi:prepilin-type N-terminal cleavage/methylation domain-containing protein
MNILNRSSKQRGDTIVEVLIVLAVVGLALAVSYSIANRSLLGVRQAQEHSEALQIAQTQIERLRVAVPNAVANGTLLTALQPAPNQYFCMEADSTSIVPVPTATYPLLPSPPPFNLSAYDTNCQIQSRYGVAITYTAGVYNVQVRWDDVASSASFDNIDLAYKVYVP